jgi:hypothetical protein
MGVNSRGNSLADDRSEFPTPNSQPVSSPSPRPLPLCTTHAASGRRRRPSCPTTSQPQARPARTRRRVRAQRPPLHSALREPACPRCPTPCRRAPCSLEPNPTLPRPREFDPKRRRNPPAPLASHARTGWVVLGRPASPRGRTAHPPTHSPCACGRCVTCLPLHALLCSLGRGRAGTGAGARPQRPGPGKSSGRAHGRLRRPACHWALARAPLPCSQCPAQPACYACTMHAGLAGGRPLPPPRVKRPTVPRSGGTRRAELRLRACVRACMHGRAPARRPQCGLQCTAQGRPDA